MKKDERGGKREQENLGNKSMDSALTQAEINLAEVCDNGVYLPGRKSREDRNTSLSFCLSQVNVFIHLSGVVAGTYECGCSN